MIKKFEDDMDALVADASDMGYLALSMLKKSTESFDKRDTELARELYNDYQRLTEMDTKTEEGALRALAIYQPTAVDMRTIATILKFGTYLERIGKYSLNIAKATINLNTAPPFDKMKEIQEMEQIAVEMTSIALAGFCERSLEDFEKIRTLEGRIDALKKEVVRGAVTYLQTHPDAADVYTQYLSMSRHLERIGDHACKMAEKVTYMVIGKMMPIDQ